MKFAFVNGERQEAKPNLRGTCPACDRPTVAKCGEIKTWHWAHQGHRSCDPWWENETEWHRAWKDQFPTDWQEVIHAAEDGVTHIADVKTDRGWVIEFQHSYIDPEARRSRDAFYGKLVWVLNGKRRKTDASQFSKALQEGMSLGGNEWPRRVFVDECRPLREWAGSPSPIFFDFGGDQVLWWILAKRPNGYAYVAPYSRRDFIGGHLGELAQVAHDFDEFVKEIGALVQRYERHLQLAR